MTITDQKLEWVLTEYGKRRITEMLSNPDDKIRISMINIGSDNTGSPKDREGYPPENGDGKLFHQVNDKKIPIFEKGIAKDRENTVYFKAIIDENMCGYDISELALYEERNGQEKMFAVGVGQPIAKPDIIYGYLMSIEYTLYIESTNLLEVYDRIELDPKNEFLRETDIDALYRTILYVEGNLAEQISHNTHAIGLNRAQDLNNSISNTQLRYNSAAISTYYSSMANSVQDLQNVMGFWSFHYTDNYGVRQNIKDFSTFGNNFSTNALLGSYDQEYLGVLSSLNFKEGDYFYLDAVPSVMKNSSKIELGQLKNHDWIGKMIYAPDYNGWSYNAVIYTEEYIKQNILMYYLKADNATTTSKTITFAKYPEYLDDEHTTLNPLGGKLIIGSESFAPHTWTFNDLTHKWVSEVGTEYDELTFKSKVISYTGDPKQSDTISMTTTAKPERNEVVNFTGKQFDLVKYETKSDGTTKVSDVPFTFIASLKHNTVGTRNTLIAQSNYFTNKHNFEIVKNENNGIELTLFSGDDTKYVKFSTLDNVVPSTVYNLVVTYVPTYNKYDELEQVVHIFINNKTCSVTITKHNYEGMKENLMDTTSYTAKLIDGKNVKADGINAQVCLMALIREEFNNSIARCNSLVLNSLAGKNVYFKV